MTIVQRLAQEMWVEGRWFRPEEPKFICGFAEFRSGSLEHVVWGPIKETKSICGRQQVGVASWRR